MFAMTVNTTVWLQYHRTTTTRGLYTHNSQHATAAVAANKACNGAMHAQSLYTDAGRTWHPHVDGAGRASGHR